MNNYHLTKWPPKILTLRRDDNSSTIKQPNAPTYPTIHYDDMPLANTTWIELHQKMAPTTKPPTMY